jgi:hypothetical protein
MHIHSNSVGVSSDEYGLLYSSRSYDRSAYVEPIPIHGWVFCVDAWIPLSYNRKRSVGRDGIYSRRRHVTQSMGGSRRARGLR